MGRRRCIVAVCFEIQPALHVPKVQELVDDSSSKGWGIDTSSRIYERSTKECNVEVIQMHSLTVPGATEVSVQENKEYAKFCLRIIPFAMASCY